MGVDHVKRRKRWKGRKVTNSFEDFPYPDCEIDASVPGKAA
jgi:hypothetical protein